MKFQKEQAAISQSNWQKSYELELASAGAKVDSKGNVTTSGKWTQSEYTNAVKKYEQTGEQGVADYAETIGNQYGWDETTIDAFIDSVVAGGDTPIYNKTATAGSNGGNNWFGGIDNNATVFIDGKEYRLDDLYDLYVEAGLSKTEAKTRIINLQKELGLVK